MNHIIFEDLAEVLHGFIIQRTTDTAIIKTKNYGKVFVILDKKSFIYSDTVEDFAFEGHDTDELINLIRIRSATSI